MIKRSLVFVISTCSMLVLAGCDYVKDKYYGDSALKKVYDCSKSSEMSLINFDAAKKACAKRFSTDVHFEEPFQFDFILSSAGRFSVSSQMNTSNYVVTSLEVFVQFNDEARELQFPTAVRWNDLWWEPGDRLILTKEIGDLLWDGFRNCPEGIEVKPCWSAEVREAFGVAIFSGPEPALSFPGAFHYDELLGTITTKDGTYEITVVE